MNKTMRYTTYLWGVLYTCLLMVSCSDNELSQQKETQTEGVPLTMSVSFGLQTRVTELPNADAMNEDAKNLKHVGLYIYYADDYKADNLSSPYIRNLECKVEGGKLVPVTGEQIYIYDRMTVVAFYPYNAEMNNADRYFKIKKDEESYPITKSTYGEQKYIPYRAEMNTDPTIAYLGKLTFVPKHTAKIEVVLVSDAKDHFPKSNIKILPIVDPVTGSGIDNEGNGQKADNREQWVDGINDYPKENATPIGGKYARQYVVYIWTNPQGQPHHEVDKEHWDNIINQGDVVFQSDELTLISSQTVDLNEQQVYRYGYNLDTGEIFIPTSSNLVCDQTTLEKVNGLSNNGAYQVCHIKLNTSDWTPLTMTNSTYDGGGHQISGLKITTMPADGKAGLFGQIKGNASLRNVNLIAPVITINAATADSCCVGALCGYLNAKLTTDEKTEVGNGLPADLSPVVKEELLKNLLSDIYNSTAQIIACRVEDPQITVSGKLPRVGTICGAAGDKDDNGHYYAKIWDSYSFGDQAKIEVTPTMTNNNDFVNVGGFCGANNGIIKRSYTTIQHVIANVTVDGATENKANGFTNPGWCYDPKDNAHYSLADCYSKNTNNGLSGVSVFASNNWPLKSQWVTYEGKWPVYSNDWKEEGDTGTGHPNPRSYWQNVGSAPSTYPILLWERLGITY